LSNGSRTSRNSALNPAPSPGSTCCVPHLAAVHHHKTYQPAACVHQGRSTLISAARARITVRWICVAHSTPHRPNNSGSDSQQSCQCSRIVSIIFSIALVINCTFCAALRSLRGPVPLTPAYHANVSCLRPMRLRGIFPNACFIASGRRRHFLLQNDLCRFIQNAIERPVIPQIQTDASRARPRRQRDQSNSMATKCKQLHFHCSPGKIPHYCRWRPSARSRATASGTLKLSFCGRHIFPTAFAVAVRA